MSLADLLHPELRGVVDAFPLPALDTEALASLRLGIEASLPTAPAVSGRVSISTRSVPAAPPVPIRVYHGPNTGKAKPGILAIHGGGLIMGNAAMYDHAFDHWCPDFDVVGISVEYRLAPETRYPGPLEDCYAALKWTYDNADELGIDPQRIGVTGISAGGGLAAGLALLARDRGEVPLAFQLLDCPMLDDRGNTPSMKAEGLYIWTAESNAFGWQAYLGDMYGTEVVPPYAAPARADDLSGLPPAFVSVGAIDGFRDEDADYALRLNRAGVPCELHIYPGVTHGYQMAQQAQIVQQAARHIDEWLARQLQT